MEKLLFAVGTAFLRVFGATLLTFALGILAAPNLKAGIALSVSALAASIAAGLRAIQVFVPQISFASFVKQPIAAWLDTFVRAGLSALIVSVTGWLLAPDLSTWKAVVTAAIVGAISAGFRAVQGIATPGESPKPEAGLTTPSDDPVLVAPPTR